MADTELKKTFRVKNFTGEDEDEWRVWSSKMLAFAQKKGYYDALVSVVDMTEEANKKLNLEAISDLTIVCDGEAWEIIRDVEEDATAHDMWSALEQAFHPEEIEDYVDLTNKFKRCEMENEYENPKIWIRKLQAINRRLGGIDVKHQHDDVQMIAEIFLKLPKSYSEFVTSSNLRGVGKGTTRDMMKDLDRFYKRTIKKENHRNGNGAGKHAFVAIGNPKKNTTTNDKFVNFTKAFKGLCNKCGKQGHKGVDCRVRPENYVKGVGVSTGGPTQFAKTHAGFSHNKGFGNKTSTLANNKVCYNCQKPGHFARNCNEKNHNKMNMFVGNVDYEEQESVTNTFMESDDEELHNGEYEHPEQYLTFDDLAALNAVLNTFDYDSSEDGSMLCWRYLPRNRLKTVLQTKADTRLIIRPMNQATVVKATTFMTTCRKKQ
jgi:hypothetical protein